MTGNTSSPPSRSSSTRRTSRFRLIWAIYAAAVGVSAPPVWLLIFELCSPYGGKRLSNPPSDAMAVEFLVLLWGFVILYPRSPKKSLWIPSLLILIIPYLGWTAFMNRTAWIWWSSRPDMATGDGFWDTPAERALGAAILDCDPRRPAHGCDIAQFETLVRSANVNTIGRLDATFTDLAVASGPNPDVISALLRAGLTVDDAHREIMRSACCESFDPPVLHAVLAAGVDPNITDTDGTPYFIHSVVAPESLALFIEAGADIDSTDRQGNTALMSAISARNFRAADVLLANGAREDRVSTTGTTMESLVAGIPPDDLAGLPPAVRALVDRRRPQ